MEEGMIEELTIEQELLLFKYRNEAFAAATSTVTDRPTAESAARRLAELGGLKAQDIVWVLSPEQGRREYEQGWTSLQDSLQDSLWTSLWVSLRDSLQDSLSDSLWGALSDPLWGALSDPLWGSLRASLQDSLSESLRAPLRDSLWSSLRDTGWLTFYRFCGELVEHKQEYLEKLQLYQQLLDSCFACWVLPGKVILCERPSAFEIQDGKLVGITWRTE
jgi:hypothetical protein